MPLLKFFVGLFILLSTSVGWSASQHIVLPGETLSQIAAANLKGHVYGATGSLNRLIQMNSWIKNPNLIYPNQVVSLEEDFVASPVRLLTGCLDVKSGGGVLNGNLEDGLSFGKDLEKNGELDRAEDLYSQLARKYPQSPLPLSALGELSQKQNNTAKAGACFAFALNLALKNIKSSVASSP